MCTYMCFVIYTFLHNITHKLGSFQGYVRKDHEFLPVPHLEFGPYLGSYISVID